MNEENLKMLIKLKNIATSVVNGDASTINVTLDEREFFIDGEQAVGAAKGILLACKVFEMQEGI